MPLASGWNARGGREPQGAQDRDQRSVATGEGCGTLVPAVRTRSRACAVRVSISRIRRSCWDGVPKILDRTSLAPPRGMVLTIGSFSFPVMVVEMNWSRTASRSELNSGMRERLRELNLRSRSIAGQETSPYP